MKAFFRYVKVGNLEPIYRMLQVDPLLVFQFDEMQQSSLIWAAKRDNTLLVRMLCKAHSRVNFKDLPGRTALNFAVMNDNEEMVKILLCFKADPGSEDNKGQSIMNMYFANKGKSTNLKIGAHMKLVRSQLFRQKYLIDFIYQAQTAVATKQEEDKEAQEKEGEPADNKKSSAPTWTRRELRDREWQAKVLDVLDPYKTIEQPEVHYI